MKNRRSYSVFTVTDGEVSNGAIVNSLTLKGAGVTIPAIIVGEEGRGRNRGVLAVNLPRDLYSVWKEKGSVEIFFAEVGTTKSGRPKLFVKENANSYEKAICVFPTTIGYRGGNNHTGDKVLSPCPNRNKEVYRSWDGICDKCGCELPEAEEGSSQVLHPDQGVETSFKPFPGEVLSKGTIAQGMAGRMGSGTQIVAVMPKEIVFCTSYSGRLYGAPSAYYYQFNGEEILAMTWEEREVADIF